jgi:anhydro-N-acetylmuramic acid kinase
VDEPGSAPTTSNATADGTRDPLRALVALRELPARRVVGLMSGTSADGTDAALVEIAGSGESTRVRLLSYVSVPFVRALRERIFGLAEADASELAELDVLLGESFAQAAEAACLKAGLPFAEVHFIASHGQTASHRPRSAGRLGATLQIGEAAVIAEKTGLPVISDFRVRDAAAGGEGAPLVPLVDHLLLRAPGRWRAIQNIGGIANVTLIGGSLSDLCAFDNAPGNMALDAVARAASRGTEAYDIDGQRAARGQVDPDLLRELHQHPYLTQAPPKSTGRELFGRGFVYPLLDRWKTRPPSRPGGAALDDLLATLTRFTAEAIVRSYREHLPVFPDEVYLCGGGAHNPTLVGHLRELCAPAPVRDTGALGLDPDAKEAIAFAVLANETLFGRPGNVPRATGAVGPRVLGKITL